MRFGAQGRSGLGEVDALDGRREALLGRRAKAFFSAHGEFGWNGTMAFATVLHCTPEVGSDSTFPLLRTTSGENGV
jgi:hypothetical protein